MNTFFTSDTHFCHYNIILYCSRPFKTANEMNEALIEAWNKKVSPGDTVYHLGDIIFSKDASQAKRLIERLNGNIEFLMGNHDHDYLLKGCSNIKNVHYGYKNIRVNDKLIVLCHFPFEEWHQMQRGSWHLCGHVHNRDADNYRTIQQLPNRLDVGVDNTPDFAPVSLDQIKRKFENAL